MRTQFITLLLLTGPTAALTAHAQCEVRIPRSAEHEALGGTAAQGLIRHAPGTECDDCEHITSFGFGFWYGSAYLIRDEGSRDLELDFDLCADRMRNFTARYPDGGERLHPLKDYQDVIGGHPSFHFEAQLSIRDLVSGELRYADVRMSLRGDLDGTGMHYTDTVRRTWPFDSLRLLPGRDAPPGPATLAEIVSGHELKVSDWRLVRAHYPFLRTLDIEVGRRISGRATGTDDSGAPGARDRDRATRSGPSSDRANMIRERARRLNAQERGPANLPRHGALAIHRTDADHHGWAVDARSRSDAEQEARAACGSNCRVVLRFSDDCAALALDASGSGTRGWARASPKLAAESSAVLDCAKGGGSSCRVAASKCSGTVP